MEGKAVGVVQCMSKNQLHERFILSFKTGTNGRGGSIVMQMENDPADYFEVGGEYVLSFERAVKTLSAGK